MINLPFFLLPFCLFISVVTNAIGYYVFLFLYPLCLVLRRKIEIPKYTTQIALVLFLMYISFSISNVLNLFFPNPEMPLSFYKEHVSVTKLIKSRLSTSYLTTALFLWALYFISSRMILSRSSAASSRGLLRDNTLKPLESFLKGSLYASIFFAICFFLEYTLKIHYRDILHNHVFQSDPAYFGQPNRPTGLLANPLTLASMSLACFAFFYTYFFRCFFLNDTHDASTSKTRITVPFAHNKKSLVLYLLLPSLLFLFILFLTLARTAIFISFFVLIVVPLFSLSKKNFWKIIFFIILLCVSAFFICKSLGYMERILYTLHRVHEVGYIDNRHFFREIYIRMFLDKPLFGNGSYWIVKGVRDHYFTLLGYADLNERNFPAHNFYLEILASGGLFCASIMVYSLWKIQSIIRRFILNPRFGNQILWISLVVAFCANLGHAFTQNNFLEASTTYTYFYLFFIIFWERIFNSNASSQNVQ